MAKSKKKSTLTTAQRDALLATLQERFAAHPTRHKGLAWADVARRLGDDALQVLHAMEETGGEPDVVEHDKKSGEVVFVDCAAESPKGRRSLCYDQEARTGRKENAPKSSALELAAEMGVQILDEAQYRALQKLGPFDAKTSSWVATPATIRQLGGALFCDYRFGTVFLYHNGAESYYAARGFRAALRV